MSTRILNLRVCFKYKRPYSWRVCATT